MCIRDSHGEKISVAALLVLEEYKRIAAAITQGRCHAKPYENEDEELLKETFPHEGQTLLPVILSSMNSLGTSIKRAVRCV